MSLDERIGSKIDFEKLVEQSGHIVKVCAPDGLLIYANPAFERVFGYPVKDSIGKLNVNDYLHPDDVEGVDKETKRAIEEAGPNGIARSWAVYRFRCADGEYRKIWAVGTFLLEEPGIEGVVLNATEFVD